MSSWTGLWHPPGGTSIREQSAVPLRLKRPGRAWAKRCAGDWMEKRGRGRRESSLEPSQYCCTSLRRLWVMMSWTLSVRCSAAPCHRRTNLLECGNELLKLLSPRRRVDWGGLEPGLYVIDPTRYVTSLFILKAPPCWLCDTQWRCGYYKEHIAGRLSSWCLAFGCCLCFITVKCSLEPESIFSFFHAETHQEKWL